MSLHYLLDGYNILHQIPGNPETRLEEQRESFICSLELKRPQGSVKNKVTLIFDGKPGRDRHEGHTGVKVCFSGGESADDQIKAIVAKAGNKKNIVVVTDDRDIQYTVRAQGVKILSVGKFLEKLGTQSSAKKCSQRKALVEERVKNIPLRVEAAINTELKDLWLKGKRGKRR